jgi:hypothetical protein
LNLQSSLPSNLQSHPQSSLQLNLRLHPQPHHPQSPHHCPRLRPPKSLPPKSLPPKTPHRARHPRLHPLKNDRLPHRRSTTPQPLLLSPDQQQPPLCSAVQLSSTMPAHSPPAKLHPRLHRQPNHAPNTSHSSQYSNQAKMNFQVEAHQKDGVSSLPQDRAHH